MEMNRAKEGMALQKSTEIDLRKLFMVLKRKLWMILLITGLLMGLAIVYNSQSEPDIYSSSSRVIISASNDMMSTVRALVREPIVLNQVIEELNLQASAGQLRSRIRVENVESSLITVISVLDTDPNTAAQIANKVVEVYGKVAQDTIGIQSLRLLTAAEAIPYPVNEKSNTIVYISFIIGLIVSISLVFLLDSLDESIRSEHDIEELLGLNMLGHVHKIKGRHMSASVKKNKHSLIRGETIGS